MKIRNPRVISAAAWLAAKTIRAWIGSLRMTYVPLGINLDPLQANFQGRFIYSFWHEGLLLPAHVYGNPKLDCYVLASHHSDGQFIAETAARLGYKFVRGSSSRGGAKAVRELMRKSSSHLAITPDGPRGPRREVQAGAIYLASRGEMPLVAVGISYDRPWRARSWDRFALPKPFRRAYCVTADPLHVPADAGRDELERFRLQFQQQMDAVQKHAELLADRRITSAAA